MVVLDDNSRVDTAAVNEHGCDANSFNDCFISAQSFF
jgi:hypothetical protein